MAVVLDLFAGPVTPASVMCAALVMLVSARMVAATAQAQPTSPAVQALRLVIGDGRPLEIGMSAAQVRELYPALKPYPRPIPSAAPSLPSIARYEVPKQAVRDLAKSSDIELRFWNDKLWVIIVYFPTEEPDRVEAALRARYGRPASENRTAVTWRQAGVTLVLAPTQRWFGFTDDQINRAVEQETAAEVERATGQWKNAAVGTMPSRRTPAPTAPTSKTMDGGTK